MCSSQQKKVLDNTHQEKKKHVYCDDECDDDVESAHANDGDDVFFENNF